MLLKMDKLQFEVENLDGLEDGVKALYQEQDGKFQLAIDGMPKAENVDGLKSALEKTREKAKAAAAYEKLGKSPEEIKTILDAQSKLEEDAAKKRGDFDAIRKQDQDKFATERDGWNTERDALLHSERTAIISNKLVTSLVKAGFTDDGIETLSTHPDVTNRIKITTEDGKRVTTIYQADGKTALAGTNKDGSASFDDLVKQLAIARPSMVKSNAQGGGGRPPGTTGSGSAKQMSRSDFDQLSPRDSAQTVKDGVKIID